MMCTLKFDKDKEISKFWADGILLNGNEAIQEAIKKAAPDIMVRTLTVIPSLNLEENSIEVLIKKLNNQDNQVSLFNRLRTYLRDPAPDDTSFDKWHNDVCNEILHELSQIYTVVNYGKAQKLLNMTFKYLYCTRYGAKENHFKYCHMALDSFTMEWFKRYVAQQWFNSKKKRALKIKVTTDGGRFPKWSNLNYTQNSLELTYEQYEQTPDIRLDDNKKYHYMFFVKTIRAYFHPTNKNNQYSGLTPLQAEFCIWPEMKLRMATEAFLFELDPIRYKESEAANAEKQNLRNLSVDTLIQRVKDTIKDYQFR